MLLTPGPYNATYFEQAYLAQYLGYTLVNGGDLTVREDRVFLKTLGGLSQVDVILRRLNDDYCDPLELRPESVLGVPGLVQAARAGNVAIASPLGTGVLQTPAILPYLAGLCQDAAWRVATLALGAHGLVRRRRTRWPRPRACSRTRWSSRPSARASCSPSSRRSWTKEARAQLLAKIKSNPRRYVVQEHVRGSTTPVLAETGLTARAVLIRAFAVAARDNYVVMPGGLARVAGRTAGTEVSMQLGAGSKDTWIISDEAVTNFSLLPPVNRPVELSRGGSDLPSRVADNLFWLGRYAERAEGVARLSRVICARLTDLISQSDLEASSEFVPLLRTLTAQTSLIYTAPLDGAVAKSLTSATEQLLAAVFDGAGRGHHEGGAALRAACRPLRARPHLHRHLARAGRRSTRSCTRPRSRRAPSGGASRWWRCRMR